MVEKYEEELKRVQATAQEKERELLSEHQAVLEEVKQQHKSKTETLQRELEEKLKKIKEVSQPADFGGGGGGEDEYGLRLTLIRLRSGFLRPSHGLFLKHLNGALHSRDSNLQGGVGCQLFSVHSEIM